jgi:uncharacterized protein YndB with AHSA1/START domain
MNRTSPTAGVFTINRHFNQAPGKVFAAFSRPEIKSRWFDGPDGCEQLERSLDVRPGGSEVLKVKWPTNSTIHSGLITHFVARYHEVTQNQRMVYSYDLMIGGKHNSTSLVVVELTAAADGTDMIFTEFVAWHDGTDVDKGLASREHGTNWGFDKMANFLVGAPSEVTTRPLNPIH